MLEFIKQYGRIDYDDDDALLNTLILVSIEFIKNATGRTILESTTDAFEQLAVAFTTLHFYENREMVVSTGAVPQRIPMTLQSLYSQLQRIQEGVDNLV